MRAQSFSSKDEVFSYLTQLGAAEHLLTHLALVSEAASMLIAQLVDLGVPFDARLVEVGAAIHDAGKIVHPEEITGGGCEHELAGEKLLLENGVDPTIARFCRTHSRYQEAESFEELLVALSDTLWKGKRIEDLELKVIDEVANKLGQERWDVFSTLDACFEKIASGGDARLASSWVCKP